jgi:transcriptional regulator of acetoin/glycerol metabolism
MSKVKTQEIVKTNGELKQEVKEKLDKAVNQVKKQSFCAIIIDMPNVKKKD